jgi:hypothetical protein
MDFVKNYITQSISVAANNLRLNSQQIEVVALLKAEIIKSENLGDDLINMKKTTELSLLAIRLNEIYNLLTQNSIDFLRISEQFKEHSRYLIKDLGHMLDITTPISFASAISKIKNGIVFPNQEIKEEIKVDLSKRSIVEVPFEKTPPIIKNEIKTQNNFLKNEQEGLISNFEPTILKPIKNIDNLLKNISENKIDREELDYYARIMNENAILSNKIGFDILSEMHRIISKSLLLIKVRDLMPGKEVIQNIRACLIVIVAVVRNKEVDINVYLKRAEEFGKKITQIKTKEL